MRKKCSSKIVVFVIVVLSNGSRIGGTHVSSNNSCLGHPSIHPCIHPSIYITMPVYNTGSSRPLHAEVLL